MSDFQRIDEFTEGNEVAVAALERRHQAELANLRARLALAVAMLERLQPFHLSSGLRIGDDPQFKEVLRALGSDTP